MDLSLGLDAVFRKIDTYTDYFINVRLVANFSYHISRYNSLALQLQYAISLPRYYLTESLQDRPDYTYRYDNRFTNRNNIVLLGFRYKFQHKEANRTPIKLQNTDKGFSVIKE